MTRKQLRKTARRWAPWWRDRLGLRDWHIDLVFIDNLEPLASVRPNYAYRRADVALSTELGRWKGEDVERVVVHELLHIHIGVLGAGLTKDSYDPGKVDSTVLAEQVINALADLLVALRRGKHKR